MQGLIHSLLLDGHGGAKQIPWEQVASITPEQGVLWIHLDYSSPQAAEWISHSAGLDPLVAQALLDENSRPRAHEYPDGLLITLRGVNLNPGEDPEDMVAIRIWLEPGRIITTRQRRMLSVSELAANLLEGKGPADIGQMVVAISRRLIMRMSGVIDQIDEQITDLEEMMLDNTTVQARDRLSQLRRQIIGLKRYLAPQREAMNTLQSIESPLLGEDDQIGLRESNERLIRHIEDLNEARERAAVLHEETVNRASDLMNQRMYVLSLVAAIFLPLGFLTGLLGINVGGIPGTDNPIAFYLFVAMLAVTTGVMLWFFRYKRWL